MAQTFNKLVFCSYCSQAGATVLGELRLTIWRAVSDLKSQKKKKKGGGERSALHRLIKKKRTSRKSTKGTLH